MVWSSFYTRDPLGVNAKVNLHLCTKFGGDEPIGFGDIPSESSSEIFNFYMEPPGVNARVNLRLCTKFCPEDPTGSGDIPGSLFYT